MVDYFMYLEDADLTRRLSKVGKCVHNPNLEIFHVWERANHKKIAMVYQAIKSYYIYSKKWGLRLF